MKELGIFRIGILGFLTVVALSGVRVHAQEICGTVPECRDFRDRSEARLKILLKDIAPVLRDVARNANGSVRAMNQHDAEKYCRSLGSTLPSARDLALLSQSMEARGIRETAHAGVVYTDPAVQTEISKMTADEYNDYYTVNSVGQPVVDFYFNYKGYRRLSCELGNYGLWSSSVTVGNSFAAYLLQGEYGYITKRGRNALNAVRCLAPR